MTNQYAAKFVANSDFNQERMPTGSLQLQRGTTAIRPTIEQSVVKAD